MGLFSKKQQTPPVIDLRESEQSKPSPFVSSAPSLECRLCTTKEFCGL